MMTSQGKWSFMGNKRTMTSSHCSWAAPWPIHLPGQFWAEAERSKPDSHSGLVGPQGGSRLPTPHTASEGRDYEKPASTHKLHQDRERCLLSSTLGPA